MATLVERLGRPEFRPGKLAEFKLRARNKFPSLKSFSGTDEMFRDVANNNNRTSDALHRESQPTAMPRERFCIPVFKLIYTFSNVSHRNGTELRRGSSGH